MEIVVQTEEEDRSELEVLELFCLLKKPGDTLTFKRPEDGIAMCCSQTNTASESSEVTESGAMGAEDVEEANDLLKDRHSESQKKSLIRGGANTSKRLNLKERGGQESAVQNKTDMADGRTAKIQNSKENQTLIEVTKTSACQWMFRIDAMDINILAEQASYVHTLGKVISGILGYKQVVLSGLCVKDNEGNRIKPQILVYIRNDIRYGIPNSLEFTKEVPAVSRAALHFRSPVFTCSPIIRSLLGKAPLYFKKDATMLGLEMVKTQAYAISYGDAISPVRDYVTNLTIQNDIDRMLDSENTYFTKQLRLILSRDGNDSDVKRFFKKVSKGLNDAEYRYLAEIVNKFPKLYDSRDELRNNLENYLMLTAPLSPGVKYGYLEVRKCKMTRRVGNFSLKKFSS